MNAHITHLEIIIFTKFHETDKMRLLKTRQCKKKVLLHSHYD